MGTHHVRFAIVLFGLVLFAAAAGSAQNTDKLRVRGARLDGDRATAHTISVIVGTKDADKNWNSRILMDVRKVGEKEWQPRHELFRHRNGMPKLCQPFAGIAWDLEPDTEYEIRLTAKDPDGVEGEAEQIIKGRTRKLPAVIKAAAHNTVTVSSRGELKKAVAEAKPGQVVLLKKGTYKGGIKLSGVKGAEDNPIVVRGEDRLETIVNGRLTLANCRNLHVENITFQKGGTGISLPKRCRAVTIRGCIILNVNNGIHAKQGHSHLYICNNALIGNAPFGEMYPKHGNDEGIVITGPGHEICNNTIGGFGDSMGFSHRTGGMATIGVDIHHNMVLWGADDAVEMDYTFRSCIVHNNLFANQLMGLSFQQTYHGPAYGFRNVIYNVAGSPYKIKPCDSANDGVFVYNNTSVKRGIAYRNWSVQVDGGAMKNNLFIGTKSKNACMTGGHGKPPGFVRFSFGNNAWSYDGAFSMKRARAGNFKQWKTKKRGKTDVLLAGEKIFQNLEPDFNKKNFHYLRDVRELDFTLHEKSSAVDAGAVIPGVTNDVTGKAPDIGAWERGSKPVKYGVDFEFTIPAKHNFKEGTMGKDYARKKKKKK